jgi:CDGSH-type Zn-finger protein
LANLALNIFYLDEVCLLSQESASNNAVKVAGNRPIGVDSVAEKTYWWCSCGRSANQPFCDGSHKGTEFSPLACQETEERKVWLCSCKQTKTPPYCDGSHKHLPEGLAIGDYLPSDS